MSTTANAVICGAGIAGVAAAYHLAVSRGLRNVVLVEEGAPLSLTSDKSTECYRNWWPGPGDAMVALMNRSIDMLEEIARATRNRIGLNRRGYLYATADPARIAAFRAQGEEAAGLGAGPLRIHGPLFGTASTASTERRGEGSIASALLPSVSSVSSVANSYIPAPAHGWEGQPTGADLITDPALIRAHFPYLGERTVAVVHARRCGWFSAQQLGMHLLEQARAHGVQLLRGRVEGVELSGGCVRAVRVATGAGAAQIATPVFVNAAGPLLPAVGRMLGIELPVFSELHLKIAFNDHLGAVPRDAPLLIWADPTRLEWQDDERAALAEADETRWLLDTFPPGVHTRPEGAGGSTLLILWDYHSAAVEPAFPFAYDPDYPEIALRGLAAMLPGLRAYLGRAPQPVVDGGYYTRTRENRPLIGPLPVTGAYVIGALSGYGLMAACAAGELLAAHILGGPLPPYAPAFLPSRYEDAGYQRLLESWGDSGQL